MHVVKLAIKVWESTSYVENVSCCMRFKCLRRRGKYSETALLVKVSFLFVCTDSGDPAGFYKLSFDFIALKCDSGYLSLLSILSQLCFDFGFRVVLLWFVSAVITVCD